MRNEWKEFKGGRWETEIDVRDFIMNNYTPYDGDDSFLKGPTADTTALWNEVLELSKKEREAGGVLDMDTKVVSTILSHGPGYLDKDKETIVGFQTDKPFKRALMPYGGIRMANRPARITAITWTLRWRSSSPPTARPTMPACLMPTLPRCAPAAAAMSSPACPMPTAAAHHRRLSPCGPVRRRPPYRG